MWGRFVEHVSCDYARGGEMKRQILGGRHGSQTLFKVGLISFDSCIWYRISLDVLGLARLSMSTEFFSVRLGVSFDAC